MSDKSPLLASALELLAQATELYAEKHQRKYKLRTSLPGQCD